MGLASKPFAWAHSGGGLAYATEDQDPVAMRRNGWEPLYKAEQSLTCPVCASAFAALLTWHPKQLPLVYNDGLDEGFEQEQGASCAQNPTSV